MQRRTVLVLGALTAFAPGRAHAQQRFPARPWRIGVLTPAESDATPLFRAFRKGMQELGYVEGRDVILDFQLAKGDTRALIGMADELVAAGVDVIVTDGAGAARAAKQATSRVPIVMATSGADPVALGLVASMARPGGNITGLTLIHGSLSAKRLELLKTIVPTADAFTILVNPHPGSEVNFRAVEHAAQSLGPIKLDRIDVATPEALRAVPPNAIAGRGPLLVLPDAMFWNHRREIVALAAAARVPALYPEREYADEGGLIAYGPNVPDNFRRAADYVDRVLKGADPAELPIQEPVKVDLVINLRTAKAQGVQLPLPLLGRADEVIE